MNLKFLILSDIHYDGTDKIRNNLETKLPVLVNAAYTFLDKDTFQLVIIVNGDIANCGKPEEFSYMKSFFDNLSLLLTKKKQDLVVKYIFTPGNHDCCFDIYEKSREYIKDLILKNDLSDDDLLYLNLKLTNYNNFVDSMDVLKPSDSNDYLNLYDISNGGHKIIILAFNSVLYFDFLHNKDRMIIGNDVFLQLGDLTNAVVIAVTHYPMEWLLRENNNFHQDLMERSNLVFMSHEHVSLSKKTEFSNSHIVYDYRLPVFADSNFINTSGFLMLSIDTVTTSFSVRDYQYKSGFYIKNYDKLIDKIANTIKPLSSFCSVKSNNYNAFLKSNSIISSMRNLLVDQIFIYPKIAIPKESNDNFDYYTYIDFENLNLLENSKVSFLVFQDSYGKTTLLKHFFNKYYNMGLLPIYILIDSQCNTLDRIQKSINTFIESMYDNSDIIIQNIDKAILLIDQCSFLKGQTIKVLEKLSDMGYKKIISIFDEKEYLFDNIETDSMQHEYFYVLKFGHEQKYNLIENWIEHSLNTDYDSVEKTQKIHEIKHLIDKANHRLNFINTPNLILIFLEAFQDNKTDSLLINGSKGAFYNYLFNKYIVEIANNSKVDQPFIEAFLQSYSYCLHKNNCLSFKDFSDEFITENLLDPEDYYTSIRKIKTALKNLNLINSDQTGNLDLSKDQFTSYLIAQYYISHDDALSNDVDILINTLYKDEIANVLLFVVHSTKNRQVIQKIVDISDSLFKGTPEITKTVEIKSFNSLISGVKDIEVLNDIKKNNRTINKKMDVLENQIIAKKNKDLKREKSEFEKTHITANRLREIINEVTSQMVGKQFTEKLLNSGFKMNLRSLKGYAILFDEYLSIVTSMNNISDDTLEKINDLVQKAVISFAAMLISLSESLAPQRNLKYIQNYIKSEYSNNNFSEMFIALIDVNLNRHSINTDYIDVLINLRNKYIKEKNFICAVVINVILDNEINYVGMESKKKRVLLEKLNPKTLHEKQDTPQKVLNNTQFNREKRQSNIQKIVNGFKKK